MLQKVETELIVTSDPYISIAEQTGVFKNQELSVIREIIDIYHHNPDKDYFMFEEYQDNTLAGFIIFGKNPLAEFAWDIYWLVVAKEYQHRGLGKQLLNRCLEFIIKHSRKAIVRIETSTKQEFVPARNLYLKNGFLEMGRIPHFYATDDDLITYYRLIEG
jgi:ribosomal protein S18 acetylase RimI-like enzyme